MSQNKKEVIISLGGIVEDEQVHHQLILKHSLPPFLQKYVAVGFGDDKDNLQNMDVCACYKEGKPN